MNKTLVAAALVCCAGFTLVVSCKKNAADNTTPTGQLNEVFAGLRGTPQTFTIQAGKDTAFTGTQGTLLHFYTNSFKNASGAIVTSGTVNIELTEMYTPGDMVANRAPTTTADGKVLQSGGEVKIVAMQNGKKLDANKYGIGFKQAAASSAPMELYYQGAAKSDSNVAWTIGNMNNKGTMAYGTTKDSIATFNNIYYMFDSCTDFNMINCDHPYDWGAGVELTNIKVIFPDHNLENNSVVYLIYPDINGSTTVAKYSTSEKTYTKYYIDVPVGKRYKIAVVGYKNGNAYYFEASGTTSTNTVVNAVPAVETIGNIKTRMHAL